MKHLLSWSAFALGFALIVCGWFLWGDRSDTAIFAMNIVISALIYGLFFSDLMVSWRNPKDKAQRKIGNLGLKWTVVFIYAIAAILIMILFCGAAFMTQLFFQGIAIVVLVAGMAVSMHSSSNIRMVHEKQVAERAGVDTMRREAKELLNAITDKGIESPEMASRISVLIEDLRFVSPSNSDSAHNLEQQFIDIMVRARAFVESLTFNIEDLSKEINRAERTLKERKAVYSN